MYGLPADFDFSVMVGRRLTWVTFANHTVIFVFGPGSDAPQEETAEEKLVFSVTSSVALKLPDVQEDEYLTFPTSSSHLPLLVSLLVDYAGVENTGDVILRFENGAVLTIFEDDVPYESYSITHHGEKIVV